MMTVWEWEEFTASASAAATSAHQRQENLHASLAPLFLHAKRQHPDDEDRLLALWDRLTDRARL
jgi:hypothetical protein